MRHINCVLKPATIDNAKAKDRRYGLTDGGGLVLEVMPSGSKTWRFKYHLNGKRENVTIGAYPAYTIKQARDRDELFWFLATLEVVLSIGFELRSRTATVRNLKADRRTLAQSQRKDIWVACAVIWVALLSDGYPMREALYLLGAVALAWFVRRTAQRLRML